MKSKSEQLPRGLRNRNPLNIRKSDQLWKGQTGHDGKFCIFRTMEDGYRAAFRILKTYNVKYHIYSVREIIYRWAPPNDHNYTRSYIERVCKEAGLKETDLIVVDSWIEEKRNDAIWLVWAMAKVENGDKYISYADMEKVKMGYELAFN
ncbi:MAG: structural protein P5 [Bacteroidaceae bacterium]|nr:structural protein P5 [Bacteroidaceae bacterium]